MVQQGIVTNNNGASSWSFELNSPLAGAWKLEQNTLRVLDIFKYGLLDGIQDESVNVDSLMYLGGYEQALII